MKFPNLRFEHCECATVNLSSTIFISKALLPAYLQHALSTIKDVQKKANESQTSHNFKRLFSSDIFIAVAIVAALSLLITALAWD